MAGYSVMKLHVLFVVTLLAVFAGPISRGQAQDAPTTVPMGFAELTANPALVDGRVVFEPTLQLGYSGDYFAASLGVSGGGFSTLGGERAALSIVPRAEAHLTYGDTDAFVQPFVAMQVELQDRWGANLGDELGVAGAVDLGTRGFICSTKELPGMCIGIGIALRVQYHFSDYAMTPGLMPAGSVILSLPVSFTVGFAL